MLDQCPRVNISFVEKDFMVHVRVNCDMTNEIRDRKGVQSPSGNLTILIFFLRFCSIVSHTACSRYLYIFQIHTYICINLGLIDFQRGLQDAAVIFI